MAQASPLLLAAVLVAIAPNLDKLTVGTALGIRGTKIATGPNLIIAGVTMAAMAGAMAFGRALTMLMPAETTLVLGSLILIVLGVWIVVARILALPDDHGAATPARACRAVRCAHSALPCR